MCVMINVLIFNTGWLRELSVIDCSHYYQHHYDQDLIHTLETTDWGLRTREFFSFFLFFFFFFQRLFSLTSYYWVIRTGSRTKLTGITVILVIWLVLYYIASKKGERFFARFMTEDLVPPDRLSDEAFSEWRMTFSWKTR